MLKEEMNYEEKEAKSVNGVIALIAIPLFLVISICIMSFGIIQMGNGFDGLGSFLLILGILGMVVNFILLFGFKILNPKEAIVLVLFGNYYGTIKKEGF